MLLALYGLGCTQATEDEVVIFAAASLLEVLEEVGVAFEGETGTKVVFNMAGSNVLAQQILAAPQADIFLSASAQWMDAVDGAGRLAEGSRRDLLANALVVIGQASSVWQVSSPCDLATLPLDYVAMGDPEAVPAGQYAKAWLRAQTCDGVSLWAQLESQVVPTPDVRAALSLVRADPDQLGIVYATDARVYAQDLKVLWAVPAAEGPPIRYVLARLAESPNPESAQQFYSFVTGEAARRIFAQHGFEPLP